MHHETAHVQSTKHEMTTATLDDDTAQHVQAPSVPLCRLLCLAAGGIVCRSGRAIQPAQPKTAERRRRAQRRHARRLLDSLCSLARHPPHPGSSQAPLFSIKVARTPLQPQSTPMALTRPVCGRGGGSSAQGPDQAQQVSIRRWRFRLDHIHHIHLRFKTAWASTVQPKDETVESARRSQPTHRAAGG